MNTNSYNIWIWQPLLAVDILEAEHCLWDYQSFLSHDGNEIKVTFHPIPKSDIQEEILSQSVSQGSGNESEGKSGTKERGEKPKFGPQPNFKDPNFDFQNELKRLPFPINLGEIEMS